MTTLFIVGLLLVTKGWAKAWNAFRMSSAANLKVEMNVLWNYLLGGKPFGDQLRRPDPWPQLSLDSNRTLVTSVRSYWIFRDSLLPHSLIGYKFDNVRLPRCLTTSYTSRQQGKKWHQKLFYDSSSSSPPIINKVMKAAERNRKKNFPPNILSLASHCLFRLRHCVPKINKEKLLKKRRWFSWWNS